ncbi:polyketide cyclase [Micrococcus flavus]|uniref:Uncharacterized protein n=1 Tax=Micrococcus flavus TaxID=384602 RepID=A0A4Y8X445_9MICC|nr:SRPBCC family protein [Micrococcus flavus]MBB4881843.1 hypothetical protein [Micrococcus flavus]TFI03607.1 polyketide cyclase [Micrococcus flavus]GGK45320.1 hypothetical protein GCM10007073_10560 [Micrococcus flavus]
MPRSARSPRADRPFVFRHRWAVPRPADEVMELLGDPLRYPEWWPAIPRAVPLPREGASAPGGPTAGERAEVGLVGLVPVRLLMERIVDDRERGVLVAALHGDLEGTVRVDVRGSAPGHCLVAWTQEVTLGTGWMRVVAAVPGGRAAMGVSHAVAMRAGRRSLGATSLPSR